MFGNKLVLLMVTLLGCAFVTNKVSCDSFDSVEAVPLVDLFDVSTILVEGRSRLGDTIVVQGVLLKNDGWFYLFQDISSAITFDIEQALLITSEKEDHRHLAELSGCFVLLSGSIGHPELTDKKLLLHNLKYYQRSGYIGASENIEKMKNPEFSGYKCELESLMQLRN